MAGNNSNSKSGKPKNPPKGKGANSVNNGSGNPPKGKGPKPAAPKPAAAGTPKPAAAAAPKPAAAAPAAASTYMVPVINASGNFVNTHLDMIVMVIPCIERSAKCCGGTTRDFMWQHLPPTGRFRDQENTLKMVCETAIAIENHLRGNTTALSTFLREKIIGNIRTDIYTVKRLITFFSTYVISYHQYAANYLEQDMDMLPRDIFEALAAFYVLTKIHIALDGKYHVPSRSEFSTVFA
jgi:hypothetical protein